MTIAYRAVKQFFDEQYSHSHLWFRILPSGNNRRLLPSFSRQFLSTNGIDSMLVSSKKRPILDTSSLTARRSPTRICRAQNRTHRARRCRFLDAPRGDRRAWFDRHTARRESDRQTVCALPKSALPSFQSPKSARTTRSCCRRSSPNKRNSPPNIRKPLEATHCARSTSILRNETARRREASVHWHWRSLRAIHNQSARIDVLTMKQPVT